MEVLKNCKNFFDNVNDYFNIKKAYSECKAHTKSKTKFGIKLVSIFTGIAPLLALIPAVSVGAVYGLGLLGNHVLKKFQGREKDDNISDIAKKVLRPSVTDEPNKVADNEKGINNFTVQIQAANLYNPEDLQAAIKQIEEIGTEAELAMYNIKASFSNPEQFPSFLAIHNGKIVGFLIAETGSSYGDFYIHRLAVHKDFRGADGKLSTEKIGTRLMLEALKKAGQCGAGKVKLSFENRSKHCKANEGFYLKSFEKFDNIKPTHSINYVDKTTDVIFPSLTDESYQKALVKVQARKLVL